MKIVRYKGSYRYKRQRRKRIIKTVLGLTAALVVIGAAVFAVIHFAERTAPAPQPDRSEQSERLLRAGEASELSLETGGSYMLTLPDDIDIREVAFSSDNSEVAPVDSAGHAEALSAGKAVITASAGEFTAQCVITVTDPEPVKKYDALSTAYTANDDILEKNAEKGKDDLYSIIVNRRTNTVTVYTYDEKGEYTVPVRAMVASCGTGGADITPTGNYSVYFTEMNWHGLYGGVYGIYVTGIEGPYLFHSVPYYTKDHSELEVDEFNKLGTNASQGCVRMMASDARWILFNCPLNTPVKIIDAEAESDPLGKPPTVKISNGLGWDPTDPHKNNPYKGKMPEIKGASDVSLSLGAEFDPMAGVTAEDICGNSMTDRISVSGDVLADKPGEYHLSYSVTDDFGQLTVVRRTVTVEDNGEQPTDNG